MELTQDQKEKILEPLRQQIVKNHNLDDLVDKIVKLYEL